MISRGCIPAAGANGKPAAEKSSAIFTATRPRRSFAGGWKGRSGDGACYRSLPQSGASSIALKLADAMSSHNRATAPSAARVNEPPRLILRTPASAKASKDSPFAPWPSTCTACKHSSTLTTPPRADWSRSLDSVAKACCATTCASARNGATICFMRFYRRSVSAGTDFMGDQALRRGYVPCGGTVGPRFRLHRQNSR